MKLYYKKPADKWEETLPIGNGSLGAMIWGGTTREQLGLNEESIWSGYYHNKNNDKAFPYLSEVRQLVLREHYKEAEELIQNQMLGEYNESYLPLGNLLFDFHHGKEVTEYQRILDINTSVTAVSYQAGGNLYHREYFASYPEKAIFLKFSCDKPDLQFTARFQSEIKYSAKYLENGIRIMAKCPEHVDPQYVNDSPNPVIQGERGREFGADLRVVYHDGKITARENSLEFTDAATVILAFSAVKEPVYQNKTYDEIRDAHIRDYRKIYDKVELYLGEQPELPTDIRLKKLQGGEKDNGLYGLYFQYGRYLLISSSRESSLPANLQGIWSWKFRAPWSSNWTTNINTQMNYWHAQSCNLQECLPPYFDFVQKICEEGKKTAAIHYHCRGFVHHHNADIWYNTNPVGLVYGEEKGRSRQTLTWSMWPMGGAWLTSELFRHYEYNPDRNFLKETAYPILKEASLFLIDWLFEYKGNYITCPSTSPENLFITKEGDKCCVTTSTAMDLAIIREVFTNFQKTCEILGLEDEILPEISERLDKLAPFQIGSQGQLLEWDREFEENDLGHRHISHLYGLFPSELFEDDNRLKEACKISLKRRLDNGGGHTGWSCAWILNVFAILEDKEKAYQYLKTLLTRSTYDNLWDAHPPFQIDGNFGGCAGIANMLVQDRRGNIKLLPALPEDFESGYVKGLRLKNGKTIDIKWSNHSLEDYKIY